MDKCGDMKYMDKSVHDIKSGKELPKKEQKARAKIQQEEGDKGLGSKAHAKIEAWKRRSEKASKASS